jgi:hypothetical protein
LAAAVEARGQPEPAAAVQGAEQVGVDRLLLLPKTPGGQGRGARDLGGQKWPRLQGWQEAREVTLRAAEKVPAGQGKAAEVSGQKKP